MSKFFIERPILANVIGIVTMVLGIVCLMNLPVAEYPNIVPPTIQVTTNYPGASASVVANTVGIPLEQGVNGVQNAIYMESTSGSDGSYTLTVTFSVGTDLDTSLSLVQNAANGALSQLPSPVQAQGVNVKKVSTAILLIESLFSDDNRFDASFLSTYAIINLRNPLARTPGVGQVKILGAGPYSMRIWLDPQKLDAFGLTVLDVQNAIQGQNAQVAAGQLGGPPVPTDQVFQFTVTTLGRLSDVDEFENIIIKGKAPTSLVSGVRQDESTKTPSAQIVRIKDVARVELGQQVFSVFSGLTGETAAHIAIFALPDANALDVATQVRAQMKTMAANFPPGMRYNSLYDTTIFINESIHAVYQTLAIAGVLVLIVILLFLQNFRAMLVPATTVPVTIIGAFAGIALLG